MNRIFEFVKVGGTWFYWWPDYEGCPSELAMVNGADDMLDSIDDKYVKLHMVNESVAKIKLSLLEMSDEGATYLCRSAKYNDNVWICPVTLEVFGEYPSNIFMSPL